MAAVCIAIIKGITVALCHLPFGSTPAPADWCSGSEMVFDQANDLIETPLWDQEALHSPNQHLILPPERLPDYEPFDKALPLDDEVKIYEILLAWTKGYINDVATACLDREEPLAKDQAATPWLSAHFSAPSQSTNHFAGATCCPSKNSWARVALASSKPS